MPEFEPTFLSAHLRVHPFTFLLPPGSTTSFALTVPSCVWVSAGGDQPKQAGL